MKYVGFDIKVNGQEARRVVMAFPDGIHHKTVADAMEGALVRQLIMTGNKKVSVEAVTAGFLHVTAQPAFGHSESTGLKSEPDDGKAFVFGDHAL